MFVYEEKILKEYRIQVLEIVGWEGVWGIFITSIFIVAFYFIPGEDFGSAENPIQASLQLIHSKELIVSMLISSLVIGPFNYFGTSLTKYASAMHRCLVDASRMCIVWFVSMCCNWESFKTNQAMGYLLIIVGNLLYYGIISLGAEKKENNEKPMKLDLEEDNNEDDEINKDKKEKAENTDDLNSTAITKKSDLAATVKAKDLIEVKN